MTDGAVVGVEQHITLVLDLSSYRSGQSASSALSTPPPWTLLHDASLFSPCSDEQGAGTVLLVSCPQGRFYHTYTFRASSTMLPGYVIGAILLSAVADERQGQLSLTYELTVSSPFTWGVYGSEGASLPTYATTWKMSKALPYSQLQKLAHPHPYQWGWFYCAGS